jgi:hypothetical protein
MCLGDEMRVIGSPSRHRNEKTAHLGVAAYGAPLLLHKSTQGLRTWARLFRASGAGASMVLGNFDVLKIA